MTPKDKNQRQPIPLRRHGWILAGMWTLAVALSLVWNLIQEKQEVVNLAHHVALTVFDRDILYRRWAAAHGGVYVQASPETPPTPYLAHLPERDLKTPSGRQLTLLNPAYMTRQVYEFASQAGQVQGHLTSLDPIRPENKPDAWESEALTAFEAGKGEVSAVVEISGQPFMRLMRPFITEQSCLGCHARQGYKVGDIRGGVSIAVPMAPLLAENWPSMISWVLGHVALWLLGLVGLVLGVKRLGQSTAAQIKAQETAAAATMAVQTIDGMLDSVIITDLQGRITHANHALTDNFGWSREVLGELPTKIIAAADIPMAQASLQECLEKGYKKDLECTLLTRDQQEVPVMINLSWLKDPDGRPMGTIGVVRDISERRAAEAVIRQLNEDLEGRVNERTAQLELANKELEGFSYSVSHDLRAPLRAIAGFARILSQEHAGVLDTAGLRLLQIISDNVSKMGRLIDDLLAFSRLGRHELKITALDMRALVGEVAAELQEAAGGRPIDWRLEPLPHVPGDRALIRQVWFNLLANAIKFTRQQERPVIAVGCRQEGDETVFYVKDNGVGFDMKYVGKIFEVFQRLHSYEEFEGTGVGLALVKRIISRHGGRVWAEGRVGEGACFYFTLPNAGQE